MESRGSLRLRFDRFELDEADARLKRDGVPVALAPKAFAVLCALARQPGALVTKNALLDAVWGHQHVSESVLKTIVSELRAALMDDAKQPRFIETASRRGYRFIGQSVDLPVAVAPISVNVPGFIGRQRELAALHAAWRRVQEGERQLVWIEGEAGVGKSQLIAHFLNSIGSARSARGQCIEHFGTGEPYLPILEALKDLCNDHPELLELMRAVAPTWLIQMPWFTSEAERASLHREVAGAHPDRMMREMRELMERFTAQRPLILVIEDIHWSDLGTLRMMEYLARQVRGTKFMWMASFRLTQVIAEDHPLKALRQELKLHRLCEELLLEPFSEREVADYVCERLGAKHVPEGFVRRLHSHTEGLPLFVSNVADTLFGESAPADELQNIFNASATSALPVPDNLAGIIQKQIGRLLPELRPLLEAASVCGMEFSANTVADMLGRDASWVMEQCDELVRKQFWLCHGGIAESARGAFDVHYAFLHALYQHVFYSYLSPAQRVTLHRRAAQSMESARAEGMAIPAAQLASHYERGHQIVPALRYYTEAARHAVAHFAPNDAIRLTETAVALLERVPDTHERSELALALVHQRGIASAQLFGIGSDQAVASFEQAQRFCDLLPESSMHALLLNGMALTRYVQGDYAQACAIADRVSITGERNGDRILQMVSNMLRGIIHGVQAEHQLATKKLELARLACAAVGDQLPYTAFVVDPVSSIHANFALPLVHLGLIDQAREHIRLASLRAQSIGQPTARMFVLWMAGMLEVRCDAPEKVAAIAASLNDFVEKNMIAHGYGPAHWLRGWAQARLGSPQEGYRLIREGYESHARLGMFTGNTETLALAAEALLLAGDDAAAERELDEATQLATRIDERIANCSLLLLRARIAGRRKQADAEHEFMRRALTQARSEASPYHELKSLVALCSSSFATKEDLGALRQLSLAWQEGRDLPLLARAAELLH